MTGKSVLGSQPLMAFVATTDHVRARGFYRDVLGLRLVEEELPFALVFDAHGTMLRVSIVKDFAAAGFTVLGWRVKGIAEAARKLAEAGVRFEQFPGLKQDALGIWKSPSGAQVGWFKDPDSNILSLTQFPV